MELRTVYSVCPLGNGIFNNKSTMCSLLLNPSVHTAGWETGRKVRVCMGVDNLAPGEQRVRGQVGL